MTVVYPSLDAPEFARDFSAVMAEIDALVSLFDAHKIDKRDPAPLDDATTAAFDAAVAALSELLERATTLRAYIFSFVATDSRNTQAQARLSEFQQGSVRLSQMLTRFTAWIGALDVDALLDRSAVARQYPFVLRRAQLEAAHLMTPAEESLAAELNVTGGGSWSRLYANVTSQLLVSIELNGKQQE